MSYYPSDFIESLRLKSDLVSLISEDTVLKGRGDRLMGLCPFPDHNEKTPSFSVSVSQGLYHCFGCKSAGNIFTYLQKQRGMDFKTALEYLAQREGVELPKPKFSKTRRKADLDYFELSEKITSFFESNLKKTNTEHLVRKYLKKRGWSPEVIKTFRLGYADSKKPLALDSKEQQKAIELGLLNRSIQDGRYFDTFRNRLVFPIVSIKKQVIGFGARVLDSSQPKYINSRDSKIFQKGHIFYGLNESARYLRQSSTALLVEGYTDFLSLWSAGFKNTVATLGTAFTSSHAGLLKRYVETVILVFDGDQAGLQASARSLPLLLKEGLKVKFLSLPENQDPDDFIKQKGARLFQEKLDSVQDLFLFLLSQKQKEVKDPLLLIDELSPLLSQVQDKAQLVIYKQRLLDCFGRDAMSLAPLLDEKIKKAGKKLVTSSSSPSPKPLDLKKRSWVLEKLNMEERLILVLCLQSESFLQRFLEEEALSCLKSEEGREIFSFLIEAYSQKLGQEKRHQEKKRDFSQLIHLMITKISDTSSLFSSSYPIFRSSNEETNEKIFQDCLDSLKRKKKHLEASSLLTDIKIQQKEDLHGLEKMFQLTKQRLKKNI